MFSKTEVLKMLNYILKCLVLLTFFNLAISDPVGQNCQVPEKVGNMIPVLVECLGTLIASGFRFLFLKLCQDILAVASV